MTDHTTLAASNAPEYCDVPILRPTMGQAKSGLNIVSLSRPSRFKICVSILFIVRVVLILIGRKRCTTTSNWPMKTVTKEGHLITFCQGVQCPVFLQSLSIEHNENQHFFFSEHGISALIKTIKKEKDVAPSQNVIIYLL